ncbi:MAG: type II secretion system protein N, partial [Myxococcota bacterium]
MNRTAIRVFNWSLLGLACLEVAMMIVALVTATLPAEPAVASLPPDPAERGPRTWNDRKVILERNLFDVAVLAPTPVPEPQENLEDTKLPLKLLGTVASGPALSWAAVQDMQAGDHVVVRLGEQLQGRAEVTRIERRCIVLQNGPRREKLCLEEDDAPTPSRRTASRARPRASARRSPVQDRLERLAEQRIALPREAVEKAARNPTS